MTPQFLAWLFYLLGIALPTPTVAPRPPQMPAAIVYYAPIAQPRPPQMPPAITR